MRSRLATLAVVFVAVRIATIVAYRDTLYYYGMVANQFGIAEAAYKGHWFAHDADLSAAALQEANRQGRYVPLEEWGRFQGSGRYTTFPAVDLPGYGYLIAMTSQWCGDHLTSRYAMVAQVGVETASLLLYAWCVCVVFGHQTGFLAGLVYALGYPFAWPIASQPMRDIFILGVYTTALAAVLLFLRGRGPVAWAAAILLLCAGSTLLWIRPHGYYFFVCLVPIVVLARNRSRRARGVFSAAVLLVPWLVFGYPLRLFNLRHYGVPTTDSVGLALWQQLGAIKDNPYGFVRKDEAMGPWIKAHFGKDLTYASPEMNHLLGEYARRVICEHPEYYLRAIGTVALEIARTPIDIVPPFRLVEYSTSRLSLAEYGRAFPGSFAYKLFNRVVLTGFFYGGLWLAVRLLLRRRDLWLEITLFLSPFLYTAATQVAIVFNERYMASGAWALVLPIASGLQELLERRRLARTGAGP